MRVGNSLGVISDIEEYNHPRYNVVSVSNCAIHLKQFHIIECYNSWRGSYE